jgi:hypothetical protein
MHEERAMRKPAAIIAALAMLLTLAVTPASAQPEEEQISLFSIFPDPSNQLVVFWNITRDDYCAWEASDFEGEPPVTTLITAVFNETPTGAVTARFQTTSSLELWTLDEGADLSGPCQDTDDSTEPWATGSARVTSTDNDLFHDDSVDMGLHRTNTFGERGQGTVRDASGDAWHYSWTFQGQADQNNEFREVVPYHTVLTARG